MVTLRRIVGNCTAIHLHLETKEKKLKEAKKIDVSNEEVYFYMKTILECILDFRTIFENFTLGLCMSRTNSMEVNARTVKHETCHSNWKGSVLYHSIVREYSSTCTWYIDCIVVGGGHANVASVDHRLLDEVWAYRPFDKTLSKRVYTVYQYE